MRCSKCDSLKKMGLEDVPSLSSQPKFFDENVKALFVEFMVGVSRHIIYYVSKVVNTSYRVSCSALWVYYFIWYSLWTSLILLQTFTLSVAFYFVFGCICIRPESFICRGLLHLKYTVEFCIFVTNGVKTKVANFLLFV